MGNLRKVERKNFNNHWEQIDFWELKKRDVFRMFKPTGEVVVGSKGETEFIAISDAYENDVGAWTVDIE